MSSSNNNYKRAGIVVLACVGLLLGAAVLSSMGGLDDNAVAEVDGVGDITQQEFDRWLVVVSTQPQQGQKDAPKPPKPGTKEYDAVKQQVMQFLVSAKWIEGEAEERGITATAEEVDRQFEQTKDQSFPTQKAYQRFLKTSGQTEEDLKFRVRLDVLSNKIREQVTTEFEEITADDVQSYYNDNESQFEQPERRDLEVVKTKTEANAEKALDRIESGDSFKEVSEDLSTDAASKGQDGRLIAVSKGQQEGAFDDAIFTSTKNKVVGPVKTDTGYYVFKVTKVTEGSKQSFKESQAGIRQLLTSQQQQQQLDRFSTSFQARWRSDTDCDADYATPDCRNGRQPVAEPPAETVEQPVKGASGTAPPALDGTGAPLVGINTGGTAIGNPAPAATALGGLSQQAGGGGTQAAALALGGAPGASPLPAGAPSGLPGGAAPGGTQTAPPAGQ